LLTSNNRLKTIFGISIPIIGGMVSQNVMNLVDTAMVGRLGNASLAAVGMASFLVFFSQAFLTGLSTGVQAKVARRKGAGHHNDLTNPLHGGLLLALLIGLPLSLILCFFAEDIFPLVNSDAEVVLVGSQYFQIRVLAIAFVGMNFCFRGYWNAVNLSAIYMRTIIIMHIVNISLNYILIFGHFGAPAMGASGAAIGTTIATVFGTAVYFLLGIRRAGEAGFLRRFPTRQLIRKLLRLSVPTGVQQTFFAAGLSVLFYIIGQVGTAELAAANVLINVLLVGILPGIALGLAAASLVGQALGRGDAADAKQWGFDVLKCGVVILGVLGLPMLLMPETIIRIFIQDPETIAVAVIPMQIAGLGLSIDSVGLVLQNALLGAGDTRRTAMVSIGMQWIVFLPAAYLVGPIAGYGLLGIWLAQTGYRGLQSILFLMMWRGEKWAQIRI